MPENEPIEKRFIFQGNAVALAGHIRRPSDFQIPSVASSCLPVTGGIAAASSGFQNFQNIVQFDSASTSASGDYADTRRAVDFTHGNHGDNDLSTQTFVDSKLEGLKVTIAQDHRPNATSKVRTFAVRQLYTRIEAFSDRRNPPAFRGLDAQILGVVIDEKHELIVTTAPEVCTHHETYDKLVKAYAEDGDFRKKFGSLFFPTGHEKTGVAAMLKHSIPNAGGIIYGTVVTSLRWAGDAADQTEIHGNRLKIEGIGSVYFGELLIGPNSRRITLLRLQLGSPDGGEIAGCDCGSVPQTWPPGS